MEHFFIIAIIALYALTICSFIFLYTLGSKIRKDLNDLIVKSSKIELELQNEKSARLIAEFSILNTISGVKVVKTETDSAYTNMDSTKR